MPDGKPVWLKMGRSDEIIYYGAIATTLTLLAYTLYQFYFNIMAPKKN